MQNFQASSTLKTRKLIKPSPEKEATWRTRKTRKAEKKIDRVMRSHQVASVVCISFSASPQHHPSITPASPQHHHLSSSFPPTRLQRIMSSLHIHPSPSSLSSLHPSPPSSPPFLPLPPSRSSRAKYRYFLPQTATNYCLRPAERPAAESVDWWSRLTLVIGRMQCPTPPPTLTENGLRPSHRKR